MRVAALLALSAVLTGCGGTDPPERRGREDPRARARPFPLEHVRCPPGAPDSCRSAVGRVLYVEANDPDGDGDAHFVLASPQGISGPGITAIDVERELRPRRLPRVGDAVAAAGPVYRGGYGQRQIQALVLRIERRR